MNKIIHSVLVVGSLALLGGVCYKAADTNVNVAGNTNGVESNTNVSINANLETNSNTKVNTNSTEIDTSNWATYTNDGYGFSFNYPKDWIFHEETSNTLSKVLQNQNSKGYVWTLDNKPVMSIYPEGGFDSSIPVENQTEYELNGKKVFEYYSDTARILFIGAPVGTSSSTFRIELYPGQINNDILNVVLNTIVIE